jgi:hypothetical protein
MRQQFWPAASMGWVQPNYRHPRSSLIGHRLVVCLSPNGLGSSLQSVIGPVLFQTYAPSPVSVNLWVSFELLACLGPVWYSFMSSFTSSFTTSRAKQPTLCPTLWSSLKTHSHRVKHMVKLPKHGSLPRSWSCSWSCFLKKTALQVKLSCCKRALTMPQKKYNVLCWNVQGLNAAARKDSTRNAISASGVKLKLQFGHSD